MPRKSKVANLIERYPSTVFKPERGQHGYLVLYSFKGPTNTRFYTDLEKLSRYVRLTKIKNGVIYAEDTNDAYLAVYLIRLYKGTGTIYESYKLNFLDFIKNYSPD